MTTRTEKKNLFLNLLNQRLRENPVWRDLFTSVSEIMDAYVNERAVQLSRVRDPQHLHRGDYLDTPQGRGKVSYIKRAFDDDDHILDEVSVEIPGVGSVVVPFRTVHERGILVNGTRSLGFDYFSDKIADEDYARIYKYISEFWQDSGTEDFVNFMGFIKNMRLEAEQLWTRDKGDHATSDAVEIRKYDFLEIFDPNSMIPVWIGSGTVGSNDAVELPAGADYPTSHVVISYDITVSQDLDLLDLVNLFYYLAPIHLVLERLQASINTTIPVYAGIASQFHIYDQGYLFMDDEDEILPPVGFLFLAEQTGEVLTEITTNELLLEVV